MVTDEEWNQVLDQVAEACRIVRSWGPEYAAILDAPDPGE